MSTINRCFTENIILSLLIILVALSFSYCSWRGPNPPNTVIRSGTGHASWYGPGFHGKFTSSGERYNMYADTCAHKELPFGTKVKITNLENGKTVVVTVNDRGPFVAGRDFDLSYAAARKLDMVGAGVIPIRFEILGSYEKIERQGVSENPSQTEDSPYFAIQAGAFVDRDRAESLKRRIEKRGYTVRITEISIEKRTFYRVRIPHLKSRNAAEEAIDTLKSMGIDAIIVHGAL